jgi:hypothetical protein
MDKVEELKARVADLEAEVKAKTVRIAELKDEVDENEALCAELREQVATDVEYLENWRTTFGMVLDDDDCWVWDGWIKRTDRIEAAYWELLKDYNKLVDRFNARIKPRPIGRPLAASKPQEDRVQTLRLLAPPASLSEIAKDTGLGVRTIRTIIGRIGGTDRTSVKRGLMKLREINRIEQASWRSGKRPGMPLHKTLSP